MDLEPGILRRLISNLMVAQVEASCSLETSYDVRAPRRVAASSGSSNSGGKNITTFLPQGSLGFRSVLLVTQRVYLRLTWTKYPDTQRD